MTTADLLAEIRDREKAATTGPWLAAHNVTTDTHDVSVLYSDGIGVVIADCRRRSADATFIAHARDDVARMADALEAFIARHEPIALQETDPATGRPHEPGTGHDWVPACRACSEEDFVAAVDAGEEVYEGDYVHWPCAEVTLIAEKLLGAAGPD